MKTAMQPEDVTGVPESSQRSAMVPDPRDMFVHSRAFIEGVLVAVMTFVCGGLMVHLDAFDWFHEFTRSHEDWELDELILIVVPLTIFLSVYAVRRLLDLKRESFARLAAEKKAHAASLELEEERRKLAEYHLDESRELLAATIESTADGILVVSSDGTMLLSNLQFDRMWSIPPPIVLERNKESLVNYMAWRTTDPERFRDGMTTDDHETRRKIDLPQTTDGHAYELCTVPLVLDGQIAGLVYSFRDKTAEHAAQRSLRLTQYSIDHSDEFILWLGPDQTIQQHNRTIRTALGYKPGELNGLAVTDLTPQMTSECWSDVMRRSRLGEHVLFETSYQIRAGGGVPVELSISHVTHGANEYHCVFGRDITDRLIAEEKQRRLVTAIEQLTEIIVITDASGAIRYTNPAFERITGYRSAEASGQNPLRLQSSHWKNLSGDALWESIASPEPWTGQLVNRRKDGTPYNLELTVTPVVDEHDSIVNFVLVGRDITQELMLEAHMNQSQKLEAVGSLAAGVAHEINTPIQFVGDNLKFLSDAFSSFVGLIDIVRMMIDPASDCETTRSRAVELTKVTTKDDLDFLQAEIPVALTQTVDGINRVTTIVRAMKEFSHPDGGEITTAHLNEAIQSTITVARNEWKYVAELETDFDSHLRPVPCYLGDLNQVVLNILVNAAHAISDTLEDHGGRKGTITVRTRQEAEHALISISDSGSGIPPEARDRVFDQFFTTKDVGRGTGQGLAIAHSIIVNKHGGTITFETEVGKGTTFFIRLPLSGPKGLPKTESETHTRAAELAQRVVAPIVSV